MKKLIVEIFVIVLSVALLSQADVRYTVTDLGDLGGNISVANGINDSGQVVGWSYISTESYVRHAFLYDDGTMHDLGTLDGGDSVANAINNNGQVVGFTSKNNYKDAFLYDGTTMNKLSTLFGASGSVARDINDSGQVVGYSGDFSSGRAFFYDGTTMKNIVGGWASRACSINNSGQIVGESQSSSFNIIHAFMCDGTTVKDLGTLGVNSCAYDINNSGQVVGESGGHAFLYDGAVVKDIGALVDGWPSCAYAINDGGQVVGAGNVGPAGRAFLYNETEGMLDLNDLIPPESNMVLHEAMDINSSGQIVGYGYIKSIGVGVPHAFLLTPVPEPLSLSLLSLGGLVAIRRRRHPRNSNRSKKPQY